MRMRSSCPADREAMLLQRRDKVGEPVRGKLELPGGRWRAGEPPEVAVAREVKEETGLDISELLSETGTSRHRRNRACGYVGRSRWSMGSKAPIPPCMSYSSVLARVSRSASRGRPQIPAGGRSVRCGRCLDDPGQFVDQARGMLTVYFAGGAEHSGLSTAGPGGPGSRGRGTLVEEPAQAVLTRS